MAAVAVHGVRFSLSGTDQQGDLLAAGRRCPPQSSSLFRAEALSTLTFMWPGKSFLALFHD